MILRFYYDQITTPVSTGFTMYETLFSDKLLTLKLM